MLECRVVLSPNITFLSLTKKIYFGLICPQNIVPIVFWLVHVTVRKLQTGSNVLFGEQCLSAHNPAMHTTVAQCSPDCGLRSSIISQ